MVAGITPAAPPAGPGAGGGGRRSGADYLDHERVAMDAEVEALAVHASFRKG